MTDGEAQDTMHYWLAQAAKEARLAKGRKQVHIAAAMSGDQSTVNRFEQAKFGWPRDPDVTAAAYADDLDTSPIDLWERATVMWREAGGEWATVTELRERKKVTGNEGGDLDALDAELDRQESQPTAEDEADTGSSGEEHR